MTASGFGLKKSGSEYLSSPVCRRVLVEFQSKKDVACDRTHLVDDAVDGRRESAVGRGLEVVSYIDDQSACDASVMVSSCRKGADVRVRFGVARHPLTVRVKHLERRAATCRGKLIEEREQREVCMGAEANVARLSGWVAARHSQHLRPPPPRPSPTHCKAFMPTIGVEKILSKVSSGKSRARA